jgi:hypothetical protein
MNMDTGKVLLGIALVVFSGALMVNPSSAAGYNASPQVGSGSPVFAAAAFPADNPCPQNTGMEAGSDELLDPSFSCLPIPDVPRTLMSI